MSQFLQRYLVYSEARDKYLTPDLTWGSIEEAKFYIDEPQLPQAWPAISILLVNIEVLNVLEKRRC